MRLLAPVQSDDEPVALPDTQDFAPVQDVQHAEGSRSYIAVAAGIASLVWLAAAAAAIYLIARFQPASDLTLSGLAGIAAGVAAPLTAIWMIALVLSRPSQRSQGVTLSRLDTAEARFAAAACRTRHEIAAIDGLLSAVTQRVATIRDEVSGQTTQLMDAASRMENHSAAVSGSLTRDREAIELLLQRLAAGSGTARAELLQLIEALPAAEAQAGAIGAMLATGAGDARRQLSDINQLADASRERVDAARAAVEASVTRLTQAIEAIDAASSVSSERLDQRSAALTRSADTAFARSAEALETARQSVEAQMAAVNAGTEQARATLEAVGGEAGRILSEQFAQAAEQAERLTREMQNQEVRSRALVETVERGFGVLDVKLANAAQTSTATLDRLNERLSAVREQIHELATPLGGTEATARDLEVAVAALRTTTAESIDMLSAALPLHLGRTSQAVETVRAAVASLTGDMDRLKTDAAGIVAPIESGRSSVDATIAALDAQRATLQATVADVTAQLAEAKAMAADVDSSAQNAALTATTRLVEAMMRVREVAAQAEGVMRSTLDGIVTEAREALEAAGAEVVRNSFSKRVRVELNEVEAASEKAARAAQVSAERLSRQLMSVAETAAAVEAHIAQADVRIDEASRDDLARRSNLLIEALNSSSIDIAKALSTDVTDTAWAAYLKGDRGIFTRRAVRLLDGGAARAISRRFNEDNEFRDSVNRYIHDFETLIRRTTAERDGNALSVALLSSDVGKLYVALAQALERIRN